MSNFIAIHRISYMQGTLKCVCRHEDEFALAFYPETDGEELEERVLDIMGWGETGICPKCEREHQSEEAADRSRYERKAGMESLGEMPIEREGL